VKGKVKGKRSTQNGGPDRGNPKKATVIGSKETTQDKMPREPTPTFTDSDDEFSET
jgi:hypothetical protein